MRKQCKLAISLLKMLCDMDEDEQPPLAINPEILLKLADYRMPFGKYAGRLLIDLPEPYVVWFANEGFPRGNLGDMLRITYEIKANGLEYLFDPLRKSNRGE